MPNRRRARTSTERTSARPTLPKAPTGIAGLDDVTGGGLPRGRPTLICGGAGSGKTVFAMEFLVHGAVKFGEPGVFMSFEEPEGDLAQNVASLGFDLPDLVARKKIAIDHVRLERGEIEETGEYDLGGLFVRLGHAIDSVKAQRVVLDTIESLFAGLSNASVLRAELRRLFQWLKDRGVTAVITGERGEGTLTRHGLEEYVSDAVILLDHRVHDQASTRRLRIVKYRGSSHGTNEYPFLIDQDGISVLPSTSIGLQHDAPSEHVSTGVARLDDMLGRKGYYRGSSVLISGTAGTGKSSLAAHFADAVCRRGGRCLFFVFEESPQQVIRNMRSIGIDLQSWETKGLLRFHAARPALQGLEMHLVTMHRAIETFKPTAVIVDPVSNLIASGTQSEVNAMLVRLVDHLKKQGLTAVYTSLTQGDEREATDTGLSSLMDTWLLLSTVELGGERNRVLAVLKSRGMAHSNQVREFVLTNGGVRLVDVYAGPEGVLTGSARQAQEAREQAAAVARQQAIEAQRRGLDRQRQVMEAEAATLRARFVAQTAETSTVIAQEEGLGQRLEQDREAMADRRRPDSGHGPAPTKRAKKAGV
jgi:circadian clock protein KaiC